MEMLSPTNRAVEVVDAPDVDESERLHVAAREAVSSARERVKIVEAAVRTTNTELVRLRALRETLLIAGAERIVAQLCDGTAGSITEAIKELTGLDTRIQVHGLALSICLEQLLPMAHGAASFAESELKDAAAIVIDAKRWARLNEQSAALDELVKSEGAVELRSSRFEDEGLIVAELHSEASAARKATDAYLARVGPAIIAMQERRALAHA
jgi:hypothetical protein